MFLAFAEGSAIELIPNGSLLIHIFLILLMIWILNRTFFRPIAGILAVRDKNKGGHSVEAEEILQKVDAKLSKIDTATREARAEGYALIEGEHKTAAANRTEQLESTRSEVAKKMAAERHSIKTQTEKARIEIVSEAQQLAEKISSSILR